LDPEVTNLSERRGGGGLARAVGSRACRVCLTLTLTLTQARAGIARMRMCVHIIRRAAAVQVAVF